MSTLKEIADSILLTWNKVDFRTVEYQQFFELVVSKIKSHYALYVRRDLERNAITEHFNTTIGVEIERVDKSLLFCKPIGCIILKTNNKIPEPVRHKSDVPFKFVGSIDKSVPYTYIQYEEFNYTLHNKITSAIPRYAYQDGYIYIFNSTLIKQILVEAPFIEVDESNNICNGSVTDCDPLNTEYPISRDIRVVIEHEIIQELAGVTNVNIQ